MDEDDLWETKKMKLKPLMNKYVVPALVGAGLTEYSFENGEYYFSNQDGNRHIIFCHSSYVKNWMRVHFHAQAPTERSQRELILVAELEYLKPNFFPKIEAEDDVGYIRKLTEQIVSIMLPYMDVIAANHIQEDEDMYRELSKDTPGRAKRFGEKYGLSVSERHLGGRMEKILESMQPDIAHRKEGFYKYYQEIIDLTAFAGEVLNHRGQCPGKWFWSSDQGDFDRYCIGALSYDILSRVISAWETGKEILNTSLEVLM